MPTPIPPGFHTLTPHINVKGAAQFIDFVKRAFGAVEVARHAAPDGRLMHATVRIGDSVLMLADDFPEFCGSQIAEGRWPFVLNLYVPDADAVWSQALAAGAEVAFPIGDQFWGDRYGQVRDPFGFTWAIATHREDVSPEELKKRQSAAFGGS
jgi:uncharacterized glyoxalase superfamily protein PhnB